MMHERPPSLIKWTGSKRSQATVIAAFFPSARRGRYFEPFLGGGAMLYYGARHFASASASDIYAPLIDLWQSVKENPDSVISKYKTEWELLQADFPNHFFSVRTRFNASPTGQDLLFLSRTCVNGIIRFNRSGEFNNSIHLSRRGMTPQLFEKTIRRWQPVISRTDFLVRDFSAVADEAKQGDFVYLDPPYVNSHNRYCKDLDLHRLMDFLDTLNTKKVLWALSFDGIRGDTDLTYELPKSLYKFHTTLRSGHSAVQKVLNGAVEGVEESLYLNYLPPGTVKTEQLHLL